MPTVKPTYRTMNVKVIVLRDVAHPTEYDREDWQVHRTAWAEFANVPAREVQEGDQIQAQYRHKVWMRYDSTIEPGMRLRTDSKEFEIMTVIDVDHVHQYLKLMVVEWQSQPTSQMTD